MKIIETAIPEVRIIEPRVFRDDRGFFMETYQRKRYQKCGIHDAFVQDNLSYSKQNALRGLHFQIKHPQAKLVQALSGEIFDVAVDLRRQSATFGQWVGVVLSDKNMRQLYIPEGFAHGFCVLSDSAHFIYKCSEFYVPEDEGGIRWNDPDINIDWPVKQPVLSQKDRGLPWLAQIASDKLPELQH